MFLGPSFSFQPSLEVIARAFGSEVENTFLAALAGECKQCLSPDRDD
jgi:hypothetical protein